MIVYPEVDCPKRKRVKNLKNCQRYYFKEVLIHYLMYIKIAEQVQLIRWTESARLSGFQAAFPCFGDSFLCECKNYDGAVNVTYVGKFSSLMSVTDSNFGIMISWDGVTGRGKWSDSQGLIKKIALRENVTLSFWTNLI